MSETYLPIYVIDDHPIYGESIYEYIKNRFPERDVVYFDSSKKALDTIPKLSLEGVLITDIDMPEINGLKLVDELLKLSENFRVVFCSAMQPGEISIERKKMLKHSFIFKDEPAKELLQCINMVLKGRRYHSPRCTLIDTSDEVLLTNKQMITLQLLKAGFSYQQIADQTGVSLNTTKSHLKNIYQKLNAENRTDCLIKAEKLNLFSSLKN